MKVLVVEDNTKLLLAMSIRLRSCGHSVHSAPDAISAMSSAVKFQPDLVLIDINLPGGDGFTVAERLASSTETNSTPYAFMTASKKEGLKQRAVELGAFGYLEKPFSATSLLELIDLCGAGDGYYE
jgi:CheY-like chemotaxis protein